MKREAGGIGVGLILFKTVEHSAKCEQVHYHSTPLFCKSTTIKWAKALKVSKKKKNSVKPNAVSHQNASWYTSADGS